MMPQLSIIIPTHNRSAVLPRTLKALARQTIAPENYEVIVVADGCQDDTAAVVQSLNLSYSLKFIEQPGSGASAARNCGAAAAAASLLLFLDDDMEATPELVAAHLATHAAHPGSVILGYFPVAAHSNVTDIFEISSNLWWANLFNTLAQPEHRFTFRDVCAGNLSLPRWLFDAAGGFDERFHRKAGEDNELGIRLLKQRSRFYFVYEAAAIHHDRPSQERSFQRATADGCGHALMVQKYPELFAVLPLRWPATGIVLGPLWRLLWTRPALAERLALALRVILNIAKAGKLRWLWGRIYGILHPYSYWVGVREELGSLAAWRRLAQDAPLKPMDFHEIEIDLANDLSHLDDILNQSQADALRVRYGATPLGFISPQVGAESLRSVHVRKTLISWLDSKLLRLLVLDRLEQTNLAEQTQAKNISLTIEAV